jgi:hypothetical protein
MPKGSIGSAKSMLKLALKCVIKIRVISAM